MSNELNNRPNGRNNTVRQVSGHRFKVGQLVRTMGIRPMVASNNTDAFRITALLPSVGGQPQYRIRNEREMHERVTTQDMLEPVLVSEKAQNNASLIARTFDRR
ncbi:hypothetical protein [Roseibium sp. M-1]